MNDKKIIIRNCPAIKEITTLLTSEPPQFQKEWRCYATGSNLKKCENINDCVIKNIVERLIKVYAENLCSRCDGCDWENGCGDKSCGTYQANEILNNLVEIVECE